VRSESEGLKPSEAGGDNVPQGTRKCAAQILAWIKVTSKIKVANDCYNCNVIASVFCTDIDSSIDRAPGRPSVSRLLYSSADRGRNVVKRDKLLKELAGCMTEVDNWNEILHAIEDAKGLWLQFALERNRPIPEPSAVTK
jgi:hypothetical protein